MNQKSSWCIFQSSDVDLAQKIKKYKRGAIDKDEMDDMELMNDLDSSSDDNDQSESGDDIDI